MELFKITAAAGSISGIRFLSPSWQPDIPAHNGQQAGKARQVLIFYLDQQRNIALRKALAGHALQSFQIAPGTVSQFLAAILSEVDLSVEEHFNEVFATAAAKGEMPDVVIFDWHDKGTFPQDVAMLSERVFGALLYCCKSIVRTKQGGTRKILFLYPEGKDNAVHPLYAAVGGFARAVYNEHPSLVVRTVGMDAASDPGAVINREMNETEPGEARYRRNQRYARRFAPLRQEDVRRPVALRDQGVYLITGGNGNLGKAITSFLYERVKARLVITGRSKLSPGGMEQVEQLQKAGAEVIYVQADLAKQEDVKRVITITRKRFNALNGIIHCAGATRDALMIHKTREQAMAVIAPKVMGAVWLDECTRNEPMDFFLSFSSVASVLGSIGQSDYAFANSFLDAFAEWRNNCMSAGFRKGNCITVNWPFWQGGGMKAPQEIIDHLSEIGIFPVSVSEGLFMFEQCLQLPAGQIMPLKEQSNNTLKTAPMKDNNTIVNREESASRQGIEAHLRQVIAEETGLPAGRVKLNETFDMYGIDSMMTLSLTRRLEQRYGSLPKTLFFEYNTLEALILYFLENHTSRLPDAVNGQQESASPVIKNAVPAGRFDLREKRKAATDQSNRRQREPLVNDIAIIGLAGKYPMADNVNEFWNNLEKGKDCIVEIPEDRWNYRDYFSPEKGKPGKIYSKWGGFINDADKFDPLFFNIAPSEAGVMDPQARIFLQTAWHVIEDAGYTRQKLRASRTGVFVGVMYSDYQLYSALAPADMPAYTSSFSYIANRVSFFLDLSGPSIAVDTMCSSSLTAIHLACRSIQQGECDMAIAGGVNLTVHPHKYLVLSQGRFAASDGRCRSFGEGGDGYVPGEGVGALLLKPLDKAQQDGDWIYGVVKGSALNHGGRTHGFTVPSPKAQGEVISAALKNAGIDPATITYIEAHGTGTSLGDPVEVAGLAKAFEQRAQDNGNHVRFQCAIGSVKSNIGHLESAAGIAAVTKVLLQFRHKRLVPSIHAGQLNHNIDFEGTPFSVQRELAPWKSPQHPLRAGVSGFGAGGANAHLILEEYNGQQLSAPFVDPGSYIMILSAKNKARLQEYAGNLLGLFTKEHTPGKKDTGNDTLYQQLLQDLRMAVSFVTNLPPQSLPDNGNLAEYGMNEKARNGLIAMVAGKHNISLPQQQFADQATVESIARYLENVLLPGTGIPADTGETEVCLYDMAYTLQTGREAMEERLALVVSSREELVEGLTAFYNGTQTPAYVYAGRINDENGDDNSWLLQGDAGKQLLEGLMEERTYGRIAQLWIKGAEVDWEKLYLPYSNNRRKPARVPLPGYPFAREVFWPVAPGQPAPAAAPASESLFRQADEGTAIKHEDPGQLRGRLENDLRKMAARLIKADPGTISVTTGLNDFGFESMHLVDLANELNNALGLDITPAIFYERNSIRSFSGFLLQEHGGKVAAFYKDVTPAAPEVNLPQPAVKRAIAAPAGILTEQDDIAIIGMSGVFPQSKDLDEFWEKLVAGEDMISEAPGDRWNWQDYAETDEAGNKRYKARWGGFISDADKFDARFFNISPLEAEMMDPQQRLLLENVWKTIEDAGYKASDLSGRKIGLFIGSQFHDYQLLLGNDMELNAQAGLGNEHSILVNRISYLLNFRGPSEPYNTACSSALVALHRAVSSIRSGESAMAVAGGISLMLSPVTTLAGETLGMLSPDGRCKTLDASANGYVRGEGVGTVLLKPLKRAIADHDHIYAVIRSAGINHGGKAASLTAPNSEAQAALLVETYEKAGIAPQTVSYLELHGTGTKLGDPVEIEGIKSAFRQLSQDSLPSQYCGIGSVKTNIGHLEPAAGIAGLIKVTLSLQHKTLPGILHLDNLNPYVKIAGTPFYIVDSTREWAPLEDAEGLPLPRRAGISSFGFGGVNAHVVLEEYQPAPVGKLPVEQQRLFVFSAKNKDRLKVYVKNMLDYLDQRRQEPEEMVLANMAYTLQAGREEMEARLAVIAADMVTLKALLQQFMEGTAARDAVFSGTRVVHEPEEEAALRERGDDIIAVNNLPDLAKHWVKGGPVNWNNLYAGELPYRMSLPAYPFERKRYWAPVNGHAKPARQEDRAKETAASSGGLEWEIRALFMKELKSDEELDMDVNFEIFGIESILSSVITQRLRERFGDFIAFTALMEYPTLRKLVSYIREGLGMPAGDEPGYTGPALLTSADKRTARLPEEVLPLNLGGNKTPSFWVHGGPGYAAFYRKLSESLGKDYPFFAFQARGVDGKKIPHSFEEMIDHYKSCILLAKPEGPYVIGGYSFGGLVAYEIARRLHLEGHEIAHLVIFDTLPSTKEALDRFYPYYGGNDNLVTIMMGNEFAGAREAGHAFVSLQDLEGIPEPLHVGHIARLAKERGRNIPLTPDEMYGYINACIRIAGHLTELTYGNYRAEPYLGSGVLYFKARCFLAASNVVFPIKEDHDPFTGYDYVGEWAKICRKGFNVVEVPSDHLHLIEEPGLQVTAREIKRVIDAAGK